MRNLVQYPVTDDEIVEYLRRHLQELTDEGGDGPRVGDMRPTLVERAIQRILDHPEAPWAPGGPLPHGQR